MFYKLKELMEESRVISIKTDYGDSVKGVIIDLKADYLVLAATKDKRNINVYIVLDKIIGWVVWR